MPDQAVVLFKRAGRAGDPDALLRLALMYVMGQGVPRDVAKGKAFIAAALSHTSPGDFHSKLERVSDWLKGQPG